MSLTESPARECVRECIPDTVIGVSALEEPRHRAAPDVISVPAPQVGVELPAASTARGAGAGARPGAAVSRPSHTWFSGRCCYGRQHVSSPAQACFLTCPAEVCLSESFLPMPSVPKALSDQNSWMDFLLASSMAVSSPARSAWRTRAWRQPRPGQGGVEDDAGFLAGHVGRSETRSASSSKVPRGLRAQFS